MRNGKAIKGRKAGRVKLRTKLTRLTPAQREEYEGKAPEGLAVAFDASGERTNELTRRLLKAKAKAKVFVLCTNQLGRMLYIGDCQGNVTFDIREALHFYQGFDDPTVKCRWWSWEISKRGLAINFQTKQL